MQRWIETFKNFVSSDEPKRLVLIGIGNPIKSDDSVGLYIVDKLRRVVGPRPSPLVRIQRPVVNPEVALSKVDFRSTRLLILDAVEAGMPAGSIIFANIDDTKYGFFVTHNLPLRMHPSIRENGRNVFILGVQPLDLSIGEKLSEVVMPAANGIVEVLARHLGGV